MARFVKGQSGNPGGRPKALGDLREIARTHTAAAIGTLVKVMNDVKATPSARVAASEALLDRGWGRAPSTLYASIDDNRIPIDSVLDGMASDLLKKFRGPTENTRITGGVNVEVESEGKGTASVLPALNVTAH